MNTNETGRPKATRPDELDAPILAPTGDNAQDRTIEGLVAQSGLEPDGVAASRFRAYLRRLMRRAYTDSSAPVRGYWHDTARLRRQVRLDDTRGHDDAA